MPLFRHIRVMSNAAATWMAHKSGDRPREMQQGPEVDCASTDSVGKREIHPTVFESAASLCISSLINEFRTPRFLGLSPSSSLAYSAEKPPAHHLPSISGHLCSTNCFRRFSCASDVLLSELSGTLKVRAHCVHTATVGTAPSHLVTRRLRVATP